MLKRARLRFGRLGLFRCDDFAGAAFGFDFGPGRGAEGVGADREFAREVAIPENLDSRHRTIGQTRAAQGRFVHSSAIVEAVQGFEINGHVKGGVPGIVEPALGNTADERHLAAFEADADRTTGAGSLALATASAGLAVAARFTLAEAFTAVLGTGAGFQIV